MTYDEMSYHVIPYHVMLCHVARIRKRALCREIGVRSKEKEKEDRR